MFSKLRKKTEDINGSNPDLKQEQITKSTESLTLTSQKAQDPIPRRLHRNASKSFDDFNKIGTASPGGSTGDLRTSSKDLQKLNTTANPAPSTSSASAEANKRFSFFNKRISRVSDFGSSSPRSSVISPLSGTSLEAELMATTTPAANSPTSPGTASILRTTKDWRSASSNTPGQYGTFRFTKKFFDAVGIDDNSAADPSSIMDYSADAEGAEDDLSVESEDLLASFVARAYVPLQIYVRDSDVPVSFKLKHTDTVLAVIQLLLDEVVKFQVIGITSKMEAPSNWRLCKVDRSSVAARIWMSEDAILNTYKIRDGDELRLHFIDDANNLKYRVPPESGLKTFKYKFEMSVKAIVDDLVAAHKLPTSNRYGLYYKKIGLWLDDKKALVAYEIDAEHVIELRTISQEFLLRVNLPDVDTRFTLKVIPTLQVNDVVSMVLYNLTTRRISMDSSVHTFKDLYAPDHLQAPATEEQKAQRLSAACGLFHATSNSWLADNKTLQECGIATGGTDDTLEFKVRYQPLTVSIPEIMASKRKDCIGTYAYDSKPSKKNIIHLMTSPTTTVTDILKILSIDNPDFRPDGSSAYGLFTRGKERLKDEDLVWKILNDNSEMEIYEYKAIPRKFKFSKDTAKIELELEPNSIVRDIIPIACRRFGIYKNTEFKQMRIAGTPTLLDNSTLLAKKISPDDVIELAVKPSSEVQKVFEDGSIWTETADNPSNITYAQDGSKTVAAATLNKLVEKLTSSDGSSDSSDYLDFLKTFVLTYQSFTSPAVFLRKLVERYHVPRNVAAGFTDFEKQRLRIQLRICNVLQQWTKKYMYDFVDFAGALEVAGSRKLTAAQQDAKKAQKLAKHNLLLSVFDFVEGIIVQDHPTIGRQIRKNLFKLRDGSYRVLKQYTRNESVVIPSPKYVKPPPEVKFHLLACDSEELARQLTIIEFDLFSKIMPYEFLNQAWTKKDADQRAPNVLAITKRFNEIAIWVVKSILEVKTVRARAKRFAKMIDVAGHLFLQNNYSTLMAFIAGFNKAAVNRLKFTAKEMNSKSLRKFSELETIMSAEGAYKNYRAKIRNANPPCVPYIGVYLLDLTYIEDGNPDNLNDLINFSKRKLIYNLIRELQVFQDTPYIFRPVEDIVSELQTALPLPVQDENPLSPVGESLGQPFPSVKAYEDHLFNLSLLREPRGVDRSQII